MEPEHLPEQRARDEKVTEKKGGFWNVRNRKLTAESPGCPSRGFPHVAFQSSHGRTSTAWMPSPSRLPVLFSIVAGHGEIFERWGWSFGDHSQHPTVRDWAGECSEAAQVSVEWSRFLQEVTWSIKAWLLLHWIWVIKIHLFPQKLLKTF